MLLMLKMLLTNNEVKNVWVQIAHLERIAMLRISLDLVNAMENLKAEKKYFTNFIAYYLLACIVLWKNDTWTTFVAAALTIFSSKCLWSSHVLNTQQWCIHILLGLAAYSAT